MFSIPTSSSGLNVIYLTDNVLSNNCGMPVKRAAALGSALSLHFSCRKQDSAPAQAIDVLDSHPISVI